MSRNEQLIRQHKLLQLLEQSRLGRSLAELRGDLVETLGLTTLSERTVRRDLEALQAAGFDVDVENTPRGSVWKLGKSLRERVRISATATELLTLSMGRRLLLPLKGTPYWQGIESLWQKMKQTLPEPVWKHFDRRWQSMLVRGTPAKAFPGPGKPRDEELVALKRELARVTKERDFLREAAAFFAKGSK